MCHFVGMNSTLKLKREAVLTQVVLSDEPSAGGAPVVAPELDPEPLADGDVGGDGIAAAAEVAEEGAARAPRVHLHVVTVAVV